MMRRQATAKVLLLTLSLAIAAPPTRAADAGKRIVSVGGANTEILYAIGAQDRVVAVDTTSIHPAAALKDKASVGYMRQLSPEGVLALAPSMLIMADGSGPKEAIGVLKQSSVPIVSVPDHYTGEGIVQKIGIIADAAGLAQRGQCLSRLVSADLEKLKALRARIGDRPARVLFVLSFVNEKPMVSGRNTAAQGVIDLAGARNAVTEFDGYKIMTDEAILASQPDAILVMRRPDLAITADEVFARAAFAATPAAQKRNLVSIDGAAALSFGPRTAQAANDLGHALYPALGAAESSAVASGAESCRG